MAKEDEAKEYNIECGNFQLNELLNKNFNTLELSLLPGTIY